MPRPASAGLASILDLVQGDFPVFTSVRLDNQVHGFHSWDSIEFHNVNIGGYVVTHFLIHPEG